MVIVLAHEYLAAGGHDWLPTRISDDVLRDYFLAASQMAHGAIPYSGFHYEYPPGSLPFLALAHAISGDAPGRFLFAWIGLMIALDLAVLAMLVRGRGWASPAATFWILAMPALGPMALARNDLITLAAVVAAVYALTRGRPATAGALLGFAVLTKVWPIVVVVLVVVLVREGARRVAAGAIGMLGIAAAVLAALGALRPMLDTLASFHTARPLEIESTWAVALLAIATVGGGLIHPVYTYFSFNIPPTRAHGLAPVAYRLSYVVEALGVAGALLVRARRRIVHDNTVWWIGVAVIAGGLAVAPVFSPQYVLWLDAVVVVLLIRERSWPVAVLTLAIGVLTQAEYPFLFASLHADAPAGVAVTAARDALVIALCAYATVVSVRSARS